MTKVESYEIPKYLKKKPSSVSKSKIKSKHKHSSANGILIVQKPCVEKWICVYCPNCGKVRNVYEMDSLKNTMNKKDIPQFIVQDIFQKYVEV